MEESPKSTTFIRIAKMQFCHDDECEHGSDIHLNVEFDDIELENSSAIAISYTWGEFDREDEFIGHDTKGTPLLLNLGKEWDVQEVRACLAMLCIENGEARGSRHAGCWIDQLCIPQTDKGIRTALASIPSIYKKLDVVVLMPVSTCSCFRRRVLEVLESEQGQTPSASSSPSPGSLLHGIHGIKDCVNSLGMCSYLDRVWTRQEFFYSRRIRLVRTSDEEMQCVRSVADVRYLSRYASLLFQRYLEVGRLDPSWAFDAVDSAVSFFMVGLQQLFQGSAQHVVDFLAGKQLLPQRERGEGVVAFMIKLADLANVSVRKTTKARDYVISVWVDCPGYVIPKDFKKMCLPGLLENAVRQLERNHRTSLMVSSIPRLLGISSDGPTLWRPREHMGRRPITYGIREVYETVMSPTPTPVMTSGKLPLRIQTPKSPPLTQLTKDYLEEFRTHDARAVFQALKPVVCNMSLAVRIKLTSGLFLDHIDLYGDEDPPVALYRLALATLVSEANDLQRILTEPVPEKISPTDDHHTAVYRQCKASGLRLMVSLTEHPRIGLTRLDPRKREELLRGPSGSVVTIYSSQVEFSSAVGENLLLEAIKDSGELLPKYHVTGIWALHQSMSRFQVDGFVDRNGQDALLV
jgi:hypothetical protein